jgi:hypothetical protein
MEKRPAAKTGLKWGAYSGASTHVAGAPLLLPPLADPGLKAIEFGGLLSGA